jgi:hypothetical protein
LNRGSFLDYSKDVSSYLMALLFAAAVLCYSVIMAPPGDTDNDRPDPSVIPRPPLSRRLPTSSRTGWHAGRDHAAHITQFW